MAKEDGLVLNGVIVESYPNAMFKVKLDNDKLKKDEECFVLATICGKIRKFSIRLSIMDRVLVELSPYDLTRGRIVRRL